MKKFFNIFVILFALVFSTGAFANTIGVIYDSGGKFDKSFILVFSNHSYFFLYLYCFCYKI